MDYSTESELKVGKMNEYQQFIQTHSNYGFIPENLKINWVSVSKNGHNARKPYWDEKKKELIDSGEISNVATLVNVARRIHPTKKHMCKKCNKTCSIYYEYPTSNTWKWLKKNFEFEKNEENKLLTIIEIYANITSSNKNELFKKYFGITINELEILLKNDQYSGNKLSPGVMSNAPDRLDGFHCYNSVCGCRSTHDKGRSEDNMKSYVRDRRAYEHFSDGKCLLANQLMGKLNTKTSICFICNNEKKMTADHIGPISLGFVHDPKNFQACCQPCNSSKNNRFTEKDIEKIKSIEKKENANLLSWWARDAWEKSKHMDNVTLKINLDKNAKKFLSIIQWLKNNKRDILETFVKTVYMDHDMSYDIHTTEISSTGDIIFQYTENASTKKTKDKQSKRTKEILLEINEKTNRKCNVTLSKEEIMYLSDIQIDNFKNTICKVLQGL